MEYEPINFAKRNDEQLGSDAKHALEILESYRKALDRLKLSPNGLSIMEIGPGSDFGAQLLLASMGAKVTLVDRFLTRFDPDYHPKLYAEVARLWDGPKKEIEAAISGGHDATSLQLLPEPAENMKSIPDASIDFIYSNAVLEHVADIGAVTSELARISKSGGMGMHQIDWRGHRDFDRPLEHLVMHEEEFQDTAPTIAYDFGNRLRLIEFRAHFEAAGFTVTEEQVTCLAEPAYLADVLPRIRSSSSSYRFWPEDDLRRVGGFLIMRRETAKEEAAARSRGTDLLAMVGSLKATSQEQYQALARYNRITEAERRISELSQALDSRDKTIASRDKKIAALTHALELGNEKIAQLDRLTKDMLCSTSWRWTAPLRWLRDAISK